MVFYNNRSPGAFRKRFNRFHGHNNGREIHRGSENGTGGRRTARISERMAQEEGGKSGCSNIT